MSEPLDRIFRTLLLVVCFTFVTVVGRNVSIEHRVTTKHDQLAALASDLVQRQVSVIFAFGTANSVRAAKAATARIPIAFANGGDAVALVLLQVSSRALAAM
jgi:putative ABC transport system substrate-binding protein